MSIKVITKLPNSEQSYKGKVKTHYYIRHCCYHELSTLLVSRHCCYHELSTLLVSRHCCYHELSTLLVSRHYCYHELSTLLVSRHCCYHALSTLLVSRHCCYHEYFLIRSNFIYKCIVVIDGYSHFTRFVYLEFSTGKFISKLKIN